MIASTLTFIGSVTPVIFQGASLVFVDCDRESWNMDPELLKDALEDCKRRGKMPKAVVPTDLYGQCCDLSQIISICNQYDIPVVCDSAEAMGAEYFTQRRSRKGAPVPSPRATGQAKTQNNIKKKTYPCRVVGGSVAEDLFERGLCLPSGTAMTDGDLDRVIKTILKCQK